VPLVEFCGVSGVGKTTLLKALSQNPAMQNWNTEQRLISFATDLYRDTSEQLSGHLLEIWTAKLRHVSGHLTTEDSKHFGLSLAAWHLRWEHNFSLKGSDSFSIVDEHLLQNFFSELVWFANAKPEDAKDFFANRTFVLLTDDPDRIVKRVRQRQIAGVVRPHINGWNDERLRSETANFQSALVSFLETNQRLSYNWIVIDLSKGLDAAVEQLVAYLLGLENSYKFTQG
jgi:thymidylate kinase